MSLESKDTPGLVHVASTGCPWIKPPFYAFQYAMALTDVNPGGIQMLGRQACETSSPPMCSEFYAFSCMLRASAVIVTSRMQLRAQILGSHGQNVAEPVAANEGPQSGKEPVNKGGYLGLMLLVEK